jgi:hypothetical protein
MKFLAKAAGLASCCLISTLSLAQAGELQLSEVELDRVTAGNQLFQPSSAFDGVNNQLAPGGLLGPPAPPPPPPALPPVAPPANQIVTTDGPATARIVIPSATGEGTIQFVIGAVSGDGFATAEAGLQGNITGGNNSRFTSGGTGANITGVFN